MQGQNLSTLVESLGAEGFYHKISTNTFGRLVCCRGT